MKEPNKVKQYKSVQILVEEKEKSKRYFLTLQNSKDDMAISFPMQDYEITGLLKSLLNTVYNKVIQ
jgi:hypothetical protein